MAASQLVNPDLANERLKATFDTEELTNFLYDGHEKTKRKRYLRKYTHCCAIQLISQLFKLTQAKVQTYRALVRLLQLLILFIPQVTTVSILFRDYYAAVLGIWHNFWLKPSFSLF